MRWFRKLWRRVDFLLHRARLERELAEEMEAHREMMGGDRKGRFGNSVRLREESRDAWSWVWLEQIWADLRYAVRVLWGAPGFTAGAVLVLALGIGVNLSEFQIFDALIFHRLTVRDASSILQFARVSKEGHTLGFPSGAIEYYRAHNRSFDWLISEDATTRMVVEGEPNVTANFVPADYFRSVSVLPAWGRLLDRRDSVPDAPPATVLGYGYWQAHFAGDPNVVGRVIHVNGKPLQIVGVAPSDFIGLWSQRPGVWLPLSARPLLIAGTDPPPQEFARASDLLFGKLKYGVTRATGDAELTSLTRVLTQLHPRHFRANERVQGEFTQESMTQAIARVPPISIFIVMILLVLFSACANLGNMLLARGLARQREIDIRMAVGASRARIVRQLMTENFLLAVLGSVAGLAFGLVASRLTLNITAAPSDMQLYLRPQLFIAGFVLALLSAMAFGLPAALRTARPKGRKSPFRKGLVGVQVTVSCLLLIASGVLAHNGIANAAIEPAFDYRNMIIVDPQLYAKDLPPAVSRQKVDSLVSRLSALPGVAGVTASVNPPVGGRTDLISVPGLPYVSRNTVAPGYFQVMGLPVLRGRVFRPEETDALVVGESTARAAWPDEDAVGKVLTVAGVRRTVTGVAKDSLANLLINSESMEVYIPLQDATAKNIELIVHTKGDPAALVRAIPGAAAGVDMTVSVSLMRSARGSFLAGQNRLVNLIAAIAAVASALAAAGMFAMVAFAVAQRKRELGIRLALGARSSHILGVLLAQNVKPAAIGVLAGSILAAILARVVRSLIVLQNRDAVDIAGFAAGLGCFVLIAVLATLSPALRALRIDPSATLREE